MIGLSSLLLAYSGFTALSLAMSRHFQQLWQRVPQQREQIALRVAGSALLLTSLVLLTRESGGPIGLIVWIGVLTASLLPLALLLSYRPRAAGLLACAAPVAALLLGS